jgi:hypothetical protein
MPIFAEWKWVENTETFLVIFHFWDDKRKTNLRMRTEEDAFESVACNPEAEQGSAFVPVITYPSESETSREYLTWAPSHPEFCFLTEILTYANLINGLKPKKKRKIRPYLEGKVTKETDSKGYYYVYFEIPSQLSNYIKEKSMVSFARNDSISFEVCLEYIDYLRNLLRPYLT